MLAAASADSPEVEERLRAYVERVRDARLEISGDDLRAAGVPESPAIGEALKQTLALKLDGFVVGPRRGAAHGAAAAGHANRIAPVPERWNAMQWDGEPGHYEVWYVTFTDPATGVGFWIRYTMVAPLPETGRGGDVLAVADGDGPGRPGPRTSGRRSASRCRR